MLSLPSFLRQTAVILVSSSPSHPLVLFLVSPSPSLCVFTKVVAFKQIRASIFDFPDLAIVAASGFLNTW